MGWGTGNIGGGSGGLNFKIVGGTSEPSATRENTIWVNTSVAITGYVFSAEAPASPTAGMVWIATGATSSVAFNALKKNGIFVYPNAVKQYVNGVWKNVAAHCYTDGEWVQFSAIATYLYKSGNYYTDLTGGWTCNNANPNGGSYGASLTKNAANMVFKASYVDGSYFANGFAKTVKKISLSEIKTISIVVSSASINADIKIALVVCDENTPYGYKNSTANTKLSSTSTEKKFTLDVSSLSGSYYVGVASSAGSDGGTSTVTIKEVYVE